jgi:hypothetical protein
MTEILQAVVIIALAGVAFTAGALGTFILIDVARNFVLRYRQAGWYPDEVGSGVWRRARWAAKRVVEWGLIL